MLLSEMPSLNSFWAWPSERASFGSFAPPKSTRITTSTMRSSGAPMDPMGRERSRGARGWQPRGVLECVVNVSEGRDAVVLDRLATAAGVDLLDLHHDPFHHRSVHTLVGEEAPRRLAVEAVASIDMRIHDGVHPRLGAVDVVPFVPLTGSTMADAIAARDAFS